MRKKQQQPTVQQAAAEPITPVQRIRADWRSLISKVTYNGMVSNVPFIIFLALLGVLYIANSHNAVEVQRKLNSQSDKLKNLHMEHTDLQTRLMNAGTESEIIRRGAALGLKPLTLPAYSLSVDSNKTTTPVEH